MLHYMTSWGMQKNSSGGTAGELYNGIWDEISNGGFGIAATLGAPFTGHGYWTFSQNSGVLGRALKSNADHFFIGFRLHRNQNPAGNPAYIITLIDGVTSQVGLAVDLNLGFTLYKNGVPVASTPINLVAPVGTSWDYFEAEIVIHPSAGVFNMWKNGNAVDAGHSGLNTRQTANSYANRVRLGAYGNGNCIMSLADHYVLDTTAGNGGTTRLGDIRIEPCYPNGAGAQTDWTPSTGSNWQNVDEAPATEDTDFNSSATSGDKDRYALTDLPAGMTGTVIAMNHQYRARKDDAGVRQVAGNLRSGSSEAAGATNSLGTSYQNWEDQHFVDPATAAAPTISAVNAFQIGLDVI